MRDYKKAFEELERKFFSLQKELRTRDELLRIKDDHMRDNEYDILKYRLASKAMNIGLWDMDLASDDPLSHLNVVTWSREFRNMLGFSDEHEFPDTLHSWSDRLHPDDRETTIAAFVAHVKDRTGKTPYDTEYRLQLENGEYRYFHALGSTVRDRDGTPRRAAGVIRDITEKKRLDEAARNALEESGRTARTVTDILNQSGAMIYAADTETNEILFMTDSMRQHFGINEEVIGRLCHEVLRDGLTGKCNFCHLDPPAQYHNTVRASEARCAITNGYYRKVSRHIVWPGEKKARIQYLSDLTDIMEVQNTLVHREKLLGAFNQMDMTLLSQKDRTFGDVMDESLKPIAEAAQLDHIDMYGFVHSGEKLRLGQIYSWDKTQGELATPDGNLKILPDDPVIENWVSRLSEGECINIHTDIATKQELHFLQYANSRTMLLVPVHIDDGFWGFAAFFDSVRDRVFDEDSIGFLQSVARYCADAFIKNQIKNELAQTEVRMRLMLDSAPLCCQLFDSNFRKFDCNLEAMRLFGFKDKTDFLERSPGLYPEFQPDGERSTDKASRYLRKTADTGWTSFEWTYQMPDGTLMPAEIVLVKVAYGDDFAIAGYSRDLREQYRLMNEIGQQAETLSHQKTTLQTIIDSIPDIVFCLDLESRFTLVNEACLAFLGIDRKTILGQDASITGFPDDLTEPMFQANKRIFDRADTQDTHEWMSPLEGPVQYFETTKAPILQDGTVSGLVGIARNITGLKQMNQALNDAVLESRKTSDIMSSILNNTEAIIYVSDRNTYELLFVNTYMKQYYGIGDDPVGQPCFGVLNKGADTPCPWCPRKELDPEPDRTLTWEMRNPQTNRYYRNTDRYIDWPGGRKVHIHHSVDLTDIRQIQDELGYNQRMLHAINHAAVLLLNSDVDTFEGSLYQSMFSLAEILDIDRISIWKNSTINGELYCSLVSHWTEKDHFTFSNASTRDVSFDRERPGWEAVLSNGSCINSLASDMPLSVQRQLDVRAVLVIPVFVEDQFWGFVAFDNCKKEKLFTKSEETILWSASVVFVHAWMRNEVLKSLHETSTLLEQALFEANLASKSKGDFLRTVSHEIRTPMNVILGLTEIKLQSEALEAHVREAFERIHASGDMLLGIINDILDMSKIEAGILEVVAEPYDTAELISATAQTNMVRKGSKPVEFILDVDENMPAQLTGDALRIKQILNNLLSNAFKYTEKGQVRLSFHTETGKSDDQNITLVIAVSDTGQGMRQDQVQHMFEMYTRFNIDINQSIPGTGLGMSILRNLLDLMNGDIRTESEQGKGSTFTVRIPQTRAGPEVLGPEMVKSLLQYDFFSNRKLTRTQITREPMPYGSVLVVDDVESNVHVARGLLAPYGLKVDTALSAFEAIEKIENGKVYDIVFMDHMMPEMDGMQAMKILKSKGYRNPVVVLTANAVIGQAEIFIQNGFDDFISKPIDLRQLNNVLNHFIRDRYLVQAPDVVRAARLHASNEEKKEASALQTEEPARVNPLFIEAFMRDASTAVSVLNEIIDRPFPWSDVDRLSFETQVHGMKSALSIIGNKESASLAQQLENANFDMGADALKARTARFIVQLRTLIQGFSTKELQSRQTGESDETFLQEKLHVIRSACETYDTRTANATIRLLRERSWPEPVERLLADIVRDLVQSDFDGITDAVDRYLDQGTHPPDTPG